MGISESKAEVKSRTSNKVTPESFFSSENIENIRNEFRKVDPLGKLGQPEPDTIHLSTLIEKILASQLNNGEELPQNNVENLFFEPIISDTDSHIERAKTFYTYFEHMTRMISKAIDDEETSHNTHFTELAKNFVSLNKSKTTSTKFLETVLSTSFEVIFDDLDVLSKEDVINFLDEMLSLLQKKCLSENGENISLVGISSPVVQSMHKFVLKLGSYPCFQILDIQCRVVFFLFQLGFAQSNISGCISALTYLLTLPPDGEFVLNLPKNTIDFTDIAKDQQLLNENNIEKDQPVHDVVDLEKEKFHFTTCSLEQSNSQTFLSIIISLSSRLMQLLDKQIEGLINGTITKSGEFFSFVVDSNQEVIDLCIKLVKASLAESSFDVQLRVQLVSLGLKIISLNLFKYCLNFSRPERTIEETDKALFHEIVELINECTFSPLAQESPVILESILAIVLFTYRYLYFPDYSLFVEFKEKLLQDLILQPVFMFNLFIFLNEPVLLYLFSPAFCELLPQYYDLPIVIDFYISALDTMTSELQFIENNNAKDNEEFIAPLISEAMHYCSSLLNNENTIDLGMKLLKHIIFRVVTIDSYPLVAGGFVQNAYPIVELLVEKCKQSQNAVKADTDFQRLVPQAFTVQKKSTIIETKHHYQDNDYIEWILDFKGASSIHFHFDPKCHTELGNDVLRIYDSIDGNNVLHALSGTSSYFPEHLEIPYSQVKVTFTSDASVNYWGIKCEASALIPKQERAPFFDNDLFLLNFLFHTIGRLILVKLQSLEVSQKEIKYKTIIKSPFLHLISKERVFSIIQQLFPDSEFNNETEQHQNNNELYSQRYLMDDEAEFLQNILDTSKELKFITFMNSCVKSLIRTKQIPETLSVERHVIATYLYQLNIIKEAMELEKKLAEFPSDKKPNIPPPQLLRLVWKALNKIKSDLSHSNQSTLKNEGKSKSLRNNYKQFVKEIVIKSTILLDQEPRKLFQGAYTVPASSSFTSMQALSEAKIGSLPDNQNSQIPVINREIIDKFIEEVRQFITSDVSISKIFEIIEVRRRRLNIRRETIDFLIHIIESDLLFGSSKISLLLPIHQSLSIVANISDVIGVTPQEIQQLSESYTKLFRSIISLIISSNESYLTLILLQILAVPTEQLISPADLENITIQLAKYASKLNTSKHIESIIAFRNVWRLVTVWAMKYPSKNIIQILKDFASNNSLESCQHKSISILTLLTQMKNIEPTPPDFIVNCMKDATPRIITACFSWLEQVLMINGCKDFNVTLNGNQYNFESFIEYILSCIGSTMCGASCKLISDDSIFQSHHYIVQEMIAFIRLCTRPFSHVKNETNSILHKVFQSFENVSDFSTLDDGRMKLICSVFAVLGFEITMYSQLGSGVFIGSKIEEHIVKISTYDPITSKMRILPLTDTDEVITKDTDASEVIPASRIPSNPIDFEIEDSEIKIIEKFLNFALNFLGKRNFSKAFTTTNSSAVANFFCFMPIILQTPRNMARFLNLFPLDLLFKFASKSTEVLEAETIGEIMHQICQITTQCFSLKKVGMQESQQQQLLPYSLVFDHISTLTFVPLRFGSVTTNIIKSTLSDECIFLGDCAMPSSVLFYFEITIKTISNQNFQIGLLEASSTVSKINMFTFDFKKGVPTARFLGEQTPTEPVRIRAGDTIGCGYTRDSILFFHNGQPLKSQIPVTSISSFVPIIITNRCPMNCSFNLGETQFVADVISSPLFDIKSDCLHKIDVQIPTSSTPIPKSYEDDDILSKFIEDGEALWDVPVQYSETTKPGAFHTSSKTPDISSEQFAEFIITDKKNSVHQCVLGQPVKISRRSLNQNQSLSRSFSFVPPEVEVRLNKFGVITEIQHDRIAKELDILTLEMKQPELNKVSSIKVDARFVDPIDDCSLIDIANYYSYMKLTNKPQGNQQHRYIKYQILKQKQLKLIRNMCLYMSRYISLCIFDYARITNSLDQYADNDSCIQIFKLAMLEISKFMPSIKVHQAWKDYSQSDFIFCDINQSKLDDVVYKCPGDLKRFNWFIRAFLLSDNVINSKFIVSLLESCLADLNSQHYNVAADIFEIIKPEMTIESWHPMPLTTIHTSIQLPKNSIGFIPVIHPLQSIGNTGVKIGPCTLVDVHSDTQLITKDCEVSFEGRESADLYGIKLGFFCVPRRIPDAFNKTPLGGVHCLTLVLSMIFSYGNTPISLSEFIKQKVFTKLTATLNIGNLFADVFSRKILAPILTSLEWKSSDITPKIQQAFDGFSSRYEYTITEWAPLSVDAQQSLIMRVFTKLLVLDTMASSLGDNPDPKKVSDLYDTYIQQQTITKETILFQQMAHAFSILCALGFGLTIPIRFPAFLIAQAWAESFELISTMKVTESTKSFEFAQMKQAELRLGEDSKLPNDYFLSIETQNGETIFLNPGDTFVSTPSFIAKVVSKSGHEEYDGEDAFSYVLTVTCTPFTHEAKRKVFVDNYALFKQHVSFMANNWMVVYDETLRRLLKTNPIFFDQVPLVIPDVILASNECIAGIPAQILRCRIYLFKCLDSYISNIVKVIEFGSDETLLGSIFNACRAAVATQFKLKTLEAVVLDGIKDPPPLLVYRFNRFKAALHRARPTNPNGESILSQFIHQTPPEKIIALKRESVPWRVDLIGEGATDLGGPGRDLFTEACMEIMDPSNGLFIQTPNKRMRNGSGQDFLIPNPTPLTEQTRQLYYYSGVLMTICYTSKLPEPFRFARFVWNFLTQRQVKLDDIYEIDYNFKQFITSLENCNNNEFQQMYMLNFTTQTTLGNTVELIAGGSTIPVTYERRLEYINKCKKFRVKEFNEQLEALRSGFQVFFPAPASSILAPWELELIICGDNNCPIDEMKRICSYPVNDPTSTMLWDVLESFTPEERMLFIKFSCGRMGLPGPGSRWVTPIHIQFRLSDAPDPEKPLPTATTCNSTVVIPRYSSVEVMAKKIRTAITFGSDIQQDHAANFGDIVQFT